MPLTANEIAVIETGVPWLPGIPPTTCRLRLYEREGTRPVVIVSELASNLGPSITNSAARVWRAIAQRLDTTQFTLIEHSGPESFERFCEPDHFDVVTLDDGKPTWRRIAHANVRELIGGPGWW